MKAVDLYVRIVKLQNIIVIRIHKLPTSFSRGVGVQVVLLINPRIREPSLIVQSEDRDSRVANH